MNQMSCYHTKPLDTQWISKFYFTSRIQDANLVYKDWKER